MPEAPTYPQLALSYLVNLLALVCVIVAVPVAIVLGVMSVVALLGWMLIALVLILVLAVAALVLGGPVVGALWILGQVDPRENVDGDLMWDYEKQEKEIHE